MIYKSLKGLLLIALATGLQVSPVQAAEQPREWELVNPAGVVASSTIEPAKRITTLEGKTVALRWNGKHNGDVVLERLAELFAKKYPNTKIIKTYQDTSLNKISGSDAESERITKAITGLKPDLVIATQCD